ncbi:PD-(D/E)XK nuclease family protein [Streptomyces sp. NBC_00726]|uniref:PD-(D/E)XK nuclease family protein n=1 Tax=Streptomyces sp. NBC_00726 TaxID=2903674 RepID=UPI00386F09DA
MVDIRLGMFGPERYRCPASDAFKAQGMRPAQRAAWKPEALETFTNGPFMAALDRLELPADGAEPRRSSKPAHEGVSRWTRHALQMYEMAFADSTELQPAPLHWRYRHRASRSDEVVSPEYRISAWARCFESVDGRLRELRLPVNRLRGRTDAERAVAALVAAEGDTDDRVEHVRVVQFALTDGRVQELFNGTRGEALALYREKGAPAIRALLDRPEYRPGSACASCRAAPVCPALPRAPGLLGIADRTRPRRSWSPTTGRGHSSCPARGYLRGLRLPVDTSIERGAAAERGRAVHAFLSARHAQGERTPCAPDVPADWVPDGYRLPPSERLLGARLLRHHAEVCPLGIADSESGRTPEPLLVFDDPAADLLVLTEPDLLYRERGSWVWRETKTTRSRRMPRDVLTAYPQLALAVRIIAMGMLAADRVELELLRPDGVELRYLDPFAPETAAAAEAVLRDQVAGWHREQLFEAVPSAECNNCEMARWCSSRPPRNPSPEAAR